MTQLAVLAPSPVFAAFALLAFLAWFGPFLIIGLVAGLSQLAAAWRNRDPFAAILAGLEFEAELAADWQSNATAAVGLFDATALEEQIATLERGEKLAADVGSLEALVAKMPQSSEVRIYVPGGDELMAVLRFVGETLAPSILFDEMPAGTSWPATTVRAEAYGLAFQPIREGREGRAQA
ncbi:MAG: hypothetical protein Q8P82_00170 [bacterium]|nr:hypothetical protein [bacterium]